MKINNIIFLFITAVGFIFIVLISLVIFQRCNPELVTIYSNGTKIVHKKEKYIAPDTIPKWKQDIPTQKTVYTKPDTAYRKRIEHNPEIPVNIVIHPTDLSVTRIDTWGNVETNYFKYKPIEIKEIRIDELGNMQIKKRTRLGIFLRKAKNYVLIASGLIVGYYAAKAITY